MDSSSEEEGSENGRVSPRTLQAIQSAMTDPADAHKRRTYVITSSSEDEEEAVVPDRSDMTEVTTGGGVSPRTLMAIQKALGDEAVEQTDLRSGSDGEVPGISVSSQESSESKHQSRTPLILSSAVSGSQEETREPRDAAVNHLVEQRHPSASSDRKPVHADRTDQTEENKVRSEDEEESSSEGTNTHRDTSRDYILK